MNVSYCMPINKIALDIGGVLFHFNMNPILDILSEKDIVDRVRGLELLFGIQKSQDLGICDIRQNLYKFNHCLSNNDLDDILDAWMTTITPSEPMIDVVEELVHKGWEVALLSNIGIDHARLVREKIPIFKQCIQHFSCEVGARKPTQLFFQSFMLRYSWGRNVKYFDDCQENILSGSEYYKGILFNLEDYKSDDEAAKAMRGHIFVE
jgi:FMN phosphatase YigB (HAD superfamily)